MGQNNEQKDTSSERDAKPLQVRLPGFITDDQIGLGDVIKGATSAIGIRTCGSCAKRAEMLNRLVTFTGGRSSR